MNEKQIIDGLSNKVYYNYNLDNSHNFFKCAGNANYYYELNINDKNSLNDLKVLSKLYKENIPFRIFGKTSNLYITENDFNGLFIKLKTDNNYIKFNSEDNTFIVSSNLLFSQLVNKGIKFGYDLSFFVGIPGMIGSAIIGNAGTNSTGRDISKYIKNIKVYNFELNKIEVVIPDDNFFSDRNSVLKQNNLNKFKYLILEATFKFDYIGEKEADLKKRQRIEFRRQSDIEGYKNGTAGSFWANGSIPKVLLKEKIKFRDILKKTELNKLEFNGAGYTSIGCFFKTNKNTKDKDVSKLLKTTIDEIKNKFDFIPYNEVQILDYDGLISALEFVKRNEMIKND